jgi:hypothetical protein
MFRVSRVTRPAAVHVTRLGHGSHAVFRTPRASMSMTAAAAKVKVALGTIGFTVAATVIGMSLDHYHHQTNEKREKAEQRALQLHRAVDIKPCSNPNNPNPREHRALECMCDRCVRCALSSRACMCG